MQYGIVLWGASEAALRGGVRGAEKVGAVFGWRVILASTR